MFHWALLSLMALAGQAVAQPSAESLVLIHQKRFAEAIPILEAEFERAANPQDKAAVATVLALIPESDFGGQDGSISRKHPRHLYAVFAIEKGRNLEAEQRLRLLQVAADGYFKQAQLERAQELYEAILSESEKRGLEGMRDRVAASIYQLGWVEINRGLLERAIQRWSLALWGTPAQGGLGPTFGLRSPMVRDLGMAWAEIGGPKKLLPRVREVPVPEQESWAQGVLRGLRRQPTVKLSQLLQSTRETPWHQALTGAALKESQFWLAEPCALLRHPRDWTAMSLDESASRFLKSQVYQCARALEGRPRSQSQEDFNGMARLLRTLSPLPSLSDNLDVDALIYSRGGQPMKACRIWSELGLSQLGQGKTHEALAYLRSLSETCPEAGKDLSDSLGLALLRDRRSAESLDQDPGVLKWYLEQSERDPGKKELLRQFADPQSPLRSTRLPGVICEKVRSDRKELGLWLDALGQGGALVSLEAYRKAWLALSVKELPRSEALPLLRSRAPLASQTLDSANLGLWVYVLGQTEGVESTDLLPLLSVLDQRKVPLTEAQLNSVLSALMKMRGGPGWEQVIWDHWGLFEDGMTRRVALREEWLTRCIQAGAEIETSIQPWKEKDKVARYILNARAKLAGVNGIDLDVPRMFARTALHSDLSLLDRVDRQLNSSSWASLEVLDPRAEQILSSAIGQVRAARGLLMKRAWTSELTLSRAKKLLGERAESLASKVESMKTPQAESQAELRKVAEAIRTGGRWE